MYFNDDLRIQKVTHNEVTNVATIEWFEDGGPGKASLLTSIPGNHSARYALVLVTAKSMAQYMRVVCGCRHNSADAVQYAASMFECAFGAARLCGQAGFDTWRCP